MVDFQQACIFETIKWVESFVIELNLCPFAKQEMDKGYPVTIAG